MKTIRASLSRNCKPKRLARVFDFVVENKIRLSPVAALHVSWLADKFLGSYDVAPTKVSRVYLSHSSFFCPMCSFPWLTQIIRNVVSTWTYNSFGMLDHHPVTHIHLFVAAATTCACDCCHRQTHRAKSIVELFVRENIHHFVRTYDVAYVYPSAY